MFDSGGHCKNAFSEEFVDWSFVYSLAFTSRAFLFMGLRVHLYKFSVYLHDAVVLLAAQTE